MENTNEFVGLQNSSQTVHSKAANKYQTIKEKIVETIDFKLQQ